MAAFRTGQSFSRSFQTEMACCSHTDASHRFPVHLCSVRRVTKRRRSEAWASGSSGSSRAGSPRGPVPGTCSLSCPRSPTLPHTPSRKVFALLERPRGGEGEEAQMEAVGGGLRAQRPVKSSSLFSRKTYQCPCSRVCGIYLFPTCFPCPPLPTTPKTRPTCSTSGWWTGSAMPASSKGLSTLPEASSPHPEPGR